MISFIIVAGLMLAVALLFVVLPLIGKRLRFGEISHSQTNLSIYRDQLRELESDLANGTLELTQYESARREVERRTLEEVEDGETSGSPKDGPKWTLALALAVLIPFVTISTYLALGAPVALDKSKVAEQQAAPHELTPQRLAQMIDGVKERLRNNPDDIEGWIMLAKTFQAVGRYQEAAQAYREATRRAPPDAQLLADFADTLAMANGRTLEGEPQQLIEQALKIDPRNVKALALGGTVAYQKQDFSEAAQLWSRVLEVVPPDTEFAQRIRESVGDAETRAGLKPGTGAAKPNVIAGAPAGVKISGNVRLGADVLKSVAPNDTVYIFARAANGPKIPLAVKRLASRDLPAAFELTEAMAMAPGMSLANFQDFLVGARISRSGSATPQAGDWESELVKVKGGAAGINLTISKLVK